MGIGSVSVNEHHTVGIVLLTKYYYFNQFNLNIRIESYRVIIKYSHTTV